MPRYSSITEDIECPNCASTDLQKAGMVDVRQRYRCKKCGKYFLNEFKNKRSGALERKIAILMHIAGAKSVDIEAILDKVNPTIARWLTHVRKCMDDEPEVKALQNSNKKEAKVVTKFSTDKNDKKRWLIIELDDDEKHFDSIVIKRKE